MKNNVMISLKSIISQDGEISETELFTKAHYNRRNDTYTFSYEDTSATGFEGSVTTITVNGNDCASIVRTGTANSNIILEKDKKYYCHYGTPYGDFQIGIMTQFIKNNIENCGELALKYTLDVNSAYLSDNEIIIRIQNFNQN
ncbi:MAG TPA: DUF1934 domain-containing protein [Ruminococcus sp.]|nr:DUF1934 domain-containing protein [Ruminococcus sp.]